MPTRSAARYVLAACAAPGRGSTLAPFRRSWFGTTPVIDQGIDLLRCQLQVLREDVGRVLPKWLRGGERAGVELAQGRVGEAYVRRSRRGGRARQPADLSIARSRLTARARPAPRRRFRRSNDVLRATPPTASASRPSTKERFRTRASFLAARGSEPSGEARAPRRDAPTSIADRPEDDVAVAGPLGGVGNDQGVPAAPSPALALGVDAGRGDHRRETAEGRRVERELEPAPPPVRAARGGGEHPADQRDPVAISTIARRTGPGARRASPSSPSGPSRPRPSPPSRPPTPSARGSRSR